jgi:pantothenate kinase
MLELQIKVFDHRWNTFDVSITHNNEMKLLLPGFNYKLSKVPLFLSQERSPFGHL